MFVFSLFDIMENYYDFNREYAYWTKNFFMIDVLFKFGYRKDYILFSFLVIYLWFATLEIPNVYYYKQKQILFLL